MRTGKIASHETIMSVGKRFRDYQTLVITRQRGRRVARSLRQVMLVIVAGPFLQDGETGVMGSGAHLVEVRVVVVALLICALARHDRQSLRPCRFLRLLQ